MQILVVSSSSDALPAMWDSRACVSIRPASFVNPVNVLSCPLLYKEDHVPHFSDVLITRSSLRSSLRPSEEVARGSDLDGVCSIRGSLGLSLCHGTASCVVTFWSIPHFCLYSSITFKIWNAHRLLEISLHPSSFSVFQNF